MIPREMVPREIVLLGSMFGKRPEIQQNDVSKLTLLCTFFLLTNPTAPLIVHNSKYSWHRSILFRNGLGFQISFNILFGMAFLASSFVVFLVQERTIKAKHVQFVSGVDPISYWDSAYTWDLINFLLPAISILVLVAAFDVPAYTGMLSTK